MLKLKYLVENFDLARLALQHWAHDEGTLAERLTWFRISSNAVYPFDRAGRLCFLRLSPAEEKRYIDLQGELDLLVFLQRAGYPAMRPIPSGSGEVLLTLETPWGRWYASAFEGVPGRPIEALPMTEALAAQYGASLGTLHAQMMTYRCPPGRCSHTDALAWIRHTLAAHSVPEAVLAEADAVSHLLEAKPRTRESYGLVHYDFEPDNVFWDGECCHVIDFEDSMLHFYAVDLVQALDEIPETYHNTFLRGYHAACPEAEVDPADFPLMQRFRDLLSYARLLHCLSEKPVPEPDWMPKLTARLEAKLQHLRNAISAK